MNQILRLFGVIFLLWLVGSLFSPAQAEGEVGPGGQYYLVRDLKSDWLTFSEKYQNYVPYSRGVNETDLSVSLLVDLLQNRRYFLLLSATRENYLFIEGALQQKLPPDSWLALDIDSLRRVHKKDRLLVTLFGGPGIEGKTALIGHARRRVESSAARQQIFPIINIKPLPTSPFEDFSIILLLVLLLLTLFTYTSAPSLFRRFVQPRDFFDASERNDLYAFTKPYNRFMVLIALFVSAGMAYLVLYLAHYGLELFYAAGYLSEGNTLTGLLLDQALLTAICMGFFFFKYLLMSVVGSVLNLGRAIDTHYIKALQLSYVFYGLCALVCFALLLPNPQWLEFVRPYLIYGVVFYYSVRVLLLYLFIDNSGRMINLYLFSYLCVVEIVPVIIGVKFAV